MKKKYFLLLLPILLLSACGNSPITDSSNSNNPGTNTPTDNTGGNTTDDNTGGNTGDNTGGNTTDDNTGGSTGGNSTTDDEDEFVPQQLDCGYKQMELPDNIDNPYVIETSTNGNLHWWNNSITDDYPENFRGIYGNNENTSSKAFYSYNASDSKQYPGGYRIDQKSKGIQTGAFKVSGLKLEVRIGISQIKSASGSYDKSIPTGYVYYFSKTGENLGKYTIAEGTFKTTTTQLKFYVTDSYVSQISYMELRFNALPIIGDKNHNIGIGSFNICSWAYGA